MILLGHMLTLLLCIMFIECTFLFRLCVSLILGNLIACWYGGAYVIVHSVIMAYLVVV